MRSGSRGSISVDWVDQSGVCCQLGAIEEWGPVRIDLQPPAVQHTNDTQVQVTDKDVRRQRERQAQPAEEKDAEQLSVEPARPIRGGNRERN